MKIGLGEVLLVLVLVFVWFVDFAPQTHIVRKGETLFSIAWRYGKTSDDIARWNRLGDGSLIYPG